MITSKELKEFGACENGYAWFCERYPNGTKLKTLISGLIKADRYDWAWWYLKKVLTKEQSVKIAIYAAEKVIDIFEKKYPKDNRPRKAIEAAKLYLKNPSAAAAADAAYAAYAAAAYAAAAYAADAAYAAYAAADAADADAAYAAHAAYADAAYAAYADAAYAAYADAAYAAYAARKKLRNDILNYAVKIVEG